MISYGYDKLVSDRLSSLQKLGAHGPVEALSFALASEFQKETLRAHGSAAPLTKCAYEKADVGIEAEGLPAVSLHARGKSNPLRRGSDTVWQPHVPATLVLIHLQDDGGVAGRMVGGRFDEEEIGTHVRDADGFAIDDQPHLDLGRMCAVILFC